MRGRMIFTIVLMFFYFISSGQTNNLSKQDSNKVLFTCAGELKYPLQAEQNNIQGTVVVVFDIDSNCNYVNIRIEKGIGFGCDEEAIRLVSHCKKTYNIHRSLIKCTPKFNIKLPVTFTKPDEE